MTTLYARKPNIHKPGSNAIQRPASNTHDNKNANATGNATSMNIDGGS